MRTATALGALALLVAIGGCQTEPPTRPEPVVPSGWRSPSTTASTLADRPVGELFRSAELQALLAEALAANADLRIAAERVELARAQFGVQRSALFPQIGGQLSWDRGRLPAGGDSNTVGGTAVLGLALSPWEIDLWGRVRAATESARRSLLAADEAHLAVRVSLVAQVASLYLQLLELDAQLAIAEETAASRRESLRLVELRFRGGVASKLEVNDATTLVASAEQSIAEILRTRIRAENALSVLAGRPPAAVARRSKLTQFELPSQLPAGLPSELLLRRPDIRAAEQAIAAADASVEAARKAFFPAITLTGLLGFASPALRDLFDSGRYAWQAGAAVAVPIFTAGRLQANLEAEEARRRIAVEEYRQAVRVAFREVDDALADYQRYGEQRTALELAVRANRERLRLSQLRYKGGVAAYFEVLDSSRQLFDAELSLVRVLRLQYSAIVDLYRALGGGLDASAVAAVRAEESTTARPDPK